MVAGEGITGAKMEKACDEAHITLNKNAVVGDSSAMNPGGVRIGESCTVPHTPCAVQISDPLAVKALLKCTSDSRFTTSVVGSMYQDVSALFHSLILLCFCAGCRCPRHDLPWSD